MAIRRLPVGSALERLELMAFNNNRDAMTFYLKCRFMVEAKMGRFVNIDGICCGSLAKGRIRW